MPLSSPSAAPICPSVAAGSSCRKHSRCGPAHGASRHRSHDRSGSRQRHGSWHRKRRGRWHRTGRRRRRRHRIEEGPVVHLLLELCGPSLVVRRRAYRGPRRDHHWIGEVRRGHRPPTRLRRHRHSRGCARLCGATLRGDALARWHLTHRVQRGRGPRASQPAPSARRLPSSSPALAHVGCPA